MAPPKRPQERKDGFDDEKKSSGKDRESSTKKAQKNPVLNAQKNIERVSPPYEKVFQYLSFDEKLLKLYTAFRDRFERNLAQFKSDTEPTPYTSVGERLYNDFLAEFDEQMLRLFKLFDVASNPVAGYQILDLSKVPVIYIDVLTPGVLAEARNIANTPPAMVIADDIDCTINFSEMKKIFVHELLHLTAQNNYVERNSKQRLLNEGITQMITEEILLANYNHGYGKEVEVATALARLDKESLFEWYQGGSQAMYQTKLEVKLGAVYGTQEANKIVSTLFSLTDRERKLIGENFGDMLEKLNKLRPPISKKSSQLLSEAFSALFLRGMKFSDLVITLRKVAEEEKDEKVRAMINKNIDDLWAKRDALFDEVEKKLRGAV